MGSEVRVRFAPSPTGYLHIGGARTALYNWLWARRNGGKFILRIEDTDRERSTDESVDVVFASMQWLGLDWDEGPLPRGGGVKGSNGPYFQMERLSIYAEWAERLIERGAAYRCYATKEEIAEARKKFEEAGGKGFRFESPWRDKREELDKPYVVRLKAPSSGATGWDDLVKGRIEVPNEQQQDSILLRSDGVPLYNFGVVVDDVTMGITLVARGDDHVINTPTQILLFEAFGEKIPTFAHMPMILGHDGKKMGKRHGAVSVLEYRDKGFLPDSVLNYLARLGWSHGDQEVFSRDELIEKFGWEHVGVAGATYDIKKFEFVQAAHLRALPSAEIAKLAGPFLEKRGLSIEDDAKLARAIEHAKPRVISLEDVALHVDYAFREPPELEEKGRAKFLTPEKKPLLEDLRSELAKVDPWTIATTEKATHDWMVSRKLEMKDYAQSVRVALTGRTWSPGIFEVMEVLGKEQSLRRLEWGASIANG
jgi:glutamyl-tRNA synthetase